MKRIGTGIISLFALFIWSACSDEKPMTTTAPVPSAAVMHADGSDSWGGGKGRVDDDDDGTPDERWVAHFNRWSGPEVALGIIGRDGGRVRLDDFEIVVPRGAVDRPTLFSITVKAGNGKKRPAMAEFGPHNQLFNVPVTVIVPWSETDAAKTRATVIWWDKRTWVPMPSSFTNDGRISTRTIHFSMYACGLTVAGG